MVRGVRPATVAAELGVGNEAHRDPNISNLKDGTALRMGLSHRGVVFSTDRNRPRSRYEASDLTDERIAGSSSREWASFDEAAIIKVSVDTVHVL